MAGNQAVGAVSSAGSSNSAVSNNATSIGNYHSATPSNINISNVFAKSAQRIKNAANGISVFSGQFQPQGAQSALAFQA